MKYLLPVAVALLWLGPVSTPAENSYSEVLIKQVPHVKQKEDFPDCPAWFNEGMGSLYEQSNERDGHIIGTTNWRLAGLQKAIDAKTLLSFKDLCATTSEQFYHDRADHYAQARYLCYYLQEHNLLVPYYQAFTKAQATDPSGWQTLLATLHLTEAQMPAWQAEWEKWAMTLHFP